MNEQEFNARASDLIERIKALVVAGKDPRPLQLELQQLLEKKDATTSRPVPTDRRRTVRPSTARRKGGSSE